MNSQTPFKSHGPDISTSNLKEITDVMFGFLSLFLSGARGHKHRLHSHTQDVVWGSQTGSNVNQMLVSPVFITHEPPGSEWTCLWQSSVNAVHVWGSAFNSWAAQGIILDTTISTLCLNGSFRKTGDNIATKVHAKHIQTQCSFYSQSKGPLSIEWYSSGDPQTMPGDPGYPWHQRAQIVLRFLCVKFCIKLWVWGGWESLLRLLERHLGDPLPQQKIKLFQGWRGFRHMYALHAADSGVIPQHHRSPKHCQVQSWRDPCSGQIG